MLDSEANLQGEFYHACKLIGLQCALEVSTRAGRLDAVVLSADRGRILAIIEVKKHAFSFLNGHSSQIIRYKRLGVPVYGLHPEKCPHRLAKTIQAKHLHESGISLLDARGDSVWTKKLDSSKTFEAKRDRWIANGLNFKASKSR
jgi:hypothetical protein